MPWPHGHSSSSAETEARSQVEVLRKHRPFSAIAFHRAAEALEVNGQERFALRWYDMALSRCIDQLEQGSGTEAELAAPVSVLVAGRRRVRTSLGMPPDELEGEPIGQAFTGCRVPRRVASGTRCPRSRCTSALLAVGPNPGRK
jgi:hypothetical protein